MSSNQILQLNTELEMIDSLCLTTSTKEDFNAVKGFIFSIESSLPIDIIISLYGIIERIKLLKRKTNTL